MSLLKFFFSGVREEAKQNHRLAVQILCFGTSAFFSDLMTADLDTWITGDGATLICKKVKANGSLFSLAFSSLLYDEALGKARFR